jgi:hypothetical protein
MTDSNQALSTLDLLIKLWPIAISLVFLISGLAVALYQVREIPKLKRQVSTKLYLESGESIYVPRQHCRDCRSDCEKLRREDGVRTDRQIDEVNRKLDQIVAAMQAVREAVAVFKDFMERHVERRSSSI